MPDYNWQCSMYVGNSIRSYTKLQLDPGIILHRLLKSNRNYQIYNSYEKNCSYVCSVKLMATKSMCSISDLPS